MRYSFPRHSRAIVAGLCMLTCATLASGQLKRSPQLRAASPALLKGFDVARAGLQELRSLPKVGVANFHVYVVLAGSLQRLNLHAHDIRSKDFKLVVHDKNGLHVVPTPANTTYRGIVSGYPDSVVAASLIDGQLNAIVRLDPRQRFWAIQPVTEVEKTASPATHIIYDSADSNAPKGVCGVAETDEMPMPQTGLGTMAATTWVCEIGCDADNAFYRQNGSSVAGTQNDVTAVMNRVATIYKADASIDYLITTIVVRTVAVYGGFASVGQIANFWLRNHGGVRRDVAHLFTGRSLGGRGVIGVAALSAICSRTRGYGVSQSRFTRNITVRTALTAHELGHNWSAPHCNGRNPCNIMCSGLGGCSRGITSFGQYAKNFIINHRRTRNCLHVSGFPPKLTSVTPARVQVHPSTKITLNGSLLSKVTKVDIGGKQIFNFKIVSDKQITFDSPRPPRLLQSVITAENATGKSNGLVMFFAATTPPKLTGFNVARVGGAMLWQWAATPQDAWFLTLSLSQKTVPFLGFNWLTNPVLILSGTADNIGFGQYALLIPGGTPTGFNFYSQVIMVNPGKGAFVGNTNVLTSALR